MGKVRQTWFDRLLCRIGGWLEIRGENLWEAHREAD